MLLILWGTGFVFFSKDVFRYISQKPEQIKNMRQVGIVVLTGGRYRIEKGLELLEQGYGSRLLISGVKKGVSFYDIADREGVVVYDDMPIDLGYEATTTVGNANEIKDWVKKYGFKTIYAVTSFYHIPRSRLEILHAVPDLDLKFIAVHSQYVRYEWWKHWGSFKFLFAEYCKYLAVKVQYLGQ